MTAGDRKQAGVGAPAAMVAEAEATAAPTHPDSLALWLSREEGAPVLLPPEKGLCGREGQTIQVPFALTGSGRRRESREVRVGIMPATRESEDAIRVNGEPQRLKLEQSISREG